MDKHLSELIIVDESKREIKETQAERVNAILQREFDEFQMTREFVLRNMHLLKCHEIPIEVSSVTNLPSHNCIIVNDLLLLSFTDAAKEIKKILDQKKKEENDDRA